MVGVRICCAVKPCMPGDNKRDSAADCAKRRHSSSHAKRCDSFFGVDGWTKTKTKRTIKNIKLNQIDKECNREMSDKKT